MGVGEIISCSAAGTHYGVIEFAPETPFLSPGVFRIAPRVDYVLQAARLGDGENGVTAYL